MEDKDTIDLSKILKIILQYKYRLLAVVLVTSLAAMAIAFWLPKQYESTALVRAKAPKAGSGISLQAASAIAMLGGGGVSNPTQSYIEMMKSRSVLDPVIAELDLPNKDKVTNVSFAKSNLKIQNTKGTDLVEITGVGRTPEEAQQIASGVTSSFQQLLTKQNQSEQSAMVKFLKDRMAISKQEMEQAEQNLEKYRQDNKVFEPDEQGKALIKKLAEYDQVIAKLQVETETNQAKLQQVNGQLAQQNAAITQYNIADNPGIQQIRESITKKQMELIEQAQRFTDKHPNVILLKKELEELKVKLHEEVSQSVDSQANTLNPVHSALLKGKMEAETEISAGQAALAAAKKIQAGNEQEISTLSAGSVTYIGLARQVKIAQEVYGVLVKNYEQTRIQEAMENMDIQIVDEANLPKTPFAPQKSLITVIGGVLGVMLSFAYVLFRYSRVKRV
ncbi:MAG: exopolysaccharide biosynthesis protein [Pelosinus sp.]|nr:exopolysaccharide biosynthesis protein [Pelosinus sp.]